MTDITLLLHEAARGDRDAFAAVYDATTDRVYGVALRVLRDREEAEHVVRETYLDLWRNPGRVERSPGSPVGSILASAHREAVRRARSRGMQHHPGRNPSDAPDRLVRDERLAELPPDQRDALTLVYFGSCSHSEVAARQGISAGDAQARIRSGLRTAHDRAVSP